MKIEKITDCCGYPVATLNGGELNCYRRYERVYFIDGSHFRYALDNHTTRQEKDPDNISVLKKFWVDTYCNFKGN